MKKLEKDFNSNNQTFEDIKHIDENGTEYWYARELQEVLDYKEWRKFENAIEKAKKACENTGISKFGHFVGADKMVQIGSGAKRKQKDYKLTRYACYLIAQNGDSRKKVIALAQTYFAIQTRKQEISEKEYSDELIANLFRISQTEQKLRRDNIQTEKAAYITHNEVGKIVRKAIEKAGGTMPEDLPTPKKSSKQLEKENKKKSIKRRLYF